MKAVLPIKKIFFLFSLGAIFFIPLTAYAVSCSNEGYTVVYVNGILTSEREADEDRARLENMFFERENLPNVHFVVGYNASHLAGLGDLLQSISQKYGKPISNYNFMQLLDQIHAEISTRKILLLGHSQGTFYTNELYAYLSSHGVSREAIAVYNIATPASSVAGGGEYLTSANDGVIAAVRAAAAHFGVPAPLSPNIVLTQIGEDEVAPFTGHDFSKVYLAGASDRIAGDLAMVLTSLASSGPVDAASCFNLPAPGPWHQAEGMGYAIGDPVASQVRTGAVFAYDTGDLALHAIARVLGKSLTFAVGAAGFAVRPAAILPSPTKQTALRAFPIIKKLYGSSLSQSDVEDLMGMKPDSSNPPISLLEKQVESASSIKPINFIPAAPTTSPKLLNKETPESKVIARAPAPLPPRPIFSGGGGYTTPTSAISPVYSFASTSFSGVNSATSTIVASSTAIEVSTPITSEPLEIAVASTTPTSTTPEPFAPFSTSSAPFSDSFDEYDFGNLYAQGLWHTNTHVWEVTGQNCFRGIGRCLASTGIGGDNWKTGVDMARGQWRLHFYVASAFSPYWVAPSIYFGSVLHPEQSAFQIMDDIPSTTSVKVLDNRGNAIASGLALKTWHTFDFSWDMSSTTDCRFSARIDDNAATASAPSLGSPADCYGNIFTDHVIGGMGLGDYSIGPGQFLVDDIEGGPLVNGCLIDCSGISTPLSDLFDTANEAPWATPATQYDSLRLGTYEIATSSGSATVVDCLTKGCLRADGWVGGLGGGGFSTYQYLENGVRTLRGAFTLWAKASATTTEESHVVGALGLCEAKWSDCISPWTYMWNDIVPNDGFWHHYYAAWRPAKSSATGFAAQSSSTIEACLMQDTLNFTACTWKPTLFQVDRGIDGIILTGFAGRPDLGDHLWFDDLEATSS